MDIKIFATSVYQEQVGRAAEKEVELLRLIQVKAEKLCNGVLIKEGHTQLSYLTKEEQAGAISLPKGLILEKLLCYLHSI